MLTRPAQAQAKALLDQRLPDAAGADISWTEDAHGNLYGWLVLEEAPRLAELAPAMARCRLRLCTMTAYDPERDPANPRRAIAYHFDLDGLTFTVTAPLVMPEAGEDGEATGRPEVPSITPWFRNADWNEREFMEMYDIAVTGHPNPRRLFLDERLDAGVMGQMIPLSTMMNGASTQDLWERIMSAKLPEGTTAVTTVAESDGETGGEARA